MQLQKLSFNVNRRANRSVRRIITGLCTLAGLIILFLYGQEQQRAGAAVQRADQQ